MKITYNWLKQYVGFDFPPKDLVHNLTMVGLEVDTHGREEYNFDGVVVGQVVEKRAHPNADRLSLCRVEVGGEQLAIVCGAPNVETGQKVPVATLGAKLTSGLKIKPTKIRGIESQGMICSETELGLSSTADGILVLDSNLETGIPFQQIVGEADYLIDIEVTPNRPDCFGILGIARDISAVCESRLNKPEIRITENAKSVTDAIRIQIHDSNKCPRYTARFIGNVKIKPSPLWLSRRLEQIGIRSINNIVDVTNFVMMETGQPLHAFDYDLLEGKAINVRCADTGEQFTTLDGKTHTLNSENLLICDKTRPVALAGIMGGLNSEVSDKTQHILLESAFFDPVNIRRSSKSLGISTESSKRFERGVDPNGVDYALDRAVQLISELTGGEVARGIADEYPNKIQPLTLTLRPDRVKQILGVEVPIKRIKSILQSLGFVVSGEEKLEVVVPTFRPDIKREIDLIEEIGRVFGYDNIPADFNAVLKQTSNSDKHQQVETEVRKTLLGFGFSEIVTYALVSKKSAKLFATESEHVRLINPLSEDLATLRPNLLASMLNSVRWNLNRSTKSVNFFELGSTFAATNAKPVEEKRLVGILTGQLRNESWQNKPSPVNFYDVKGIVEHLLQRCSFPEPDFDNFSSTWTTEQRLAVFTRNELLGHFGGISKTILDEFDIEQPVFFFDLDFSIFENQYFKQIVFKTIPKFPSVQRDLALIVAENVKAGDILSEVKKAGGVLLKQLQIFDIFRGEQIGEGKKSLALKLTFNSVERTLKEKEVDRQIVGILKKLEAKFSARLRN